MPLHRVVLVIGLCLGGLSGCGDDGEQPSNTSTGEGSSSTGSTGSSSTSSGGSSGSSTGDASGSGSSSSTGDASTTQATTGTSGTGGSDAACHPDGIYGKCSDGTGCFCLQGGPVYQVCSAMCTETSECGDAADYPGAVPGCFPLNPGAAEMICALICSDTEDCPCGLTCMPSGVPNVSLCAELQ